MKFIQQILPMAILFLTPAADIFPEYNEKYTYAKEWHEKQILGKAALGIAGGEIGFLSCYNVLAVKANASLSYALFAGELGLGFRLPSLFGKGFSLITANPKAWANYRYVTGKQADTNLPNAYAGVTILASIENYFVINTDAKPYLIHIRFFIGNAPPSSGTGSDKSSISYDNAKGLNFGGEIGFGSWMGPRFDVFEMNLRYQVFKYDIPAISESDYFSEIGILWTMHIDFI